MDIFFKITSKSLVIRKQTKTKIWAIKEDYTMASFSDDSKKNNRGKICTLRHCLAYHVIRGDTKAENPLDLSFTWFVCLRKNVGLKWKSFAVTNGEFKP